MAKGFELSLCFLGLMKRSLNMLKCFEAFDSEIKWKKMT